MNFYLIRNEKAPWGDYGNVLLYGFISKESDKIILERVGPFIPDLYSYNKYIAFVDSLKPTIDNGNLKGIDIVETIKTKIVELNWQDWDRNEKIPQKPKSGEPEDFILKGKHNQELADKINKIWVIVPKDTAKGLIDKEKKKMDEYDHISLDISNWNGDDIFRTPQLGHVFCTENFKLLVESFSNSFLKFVPINIKNEL